MHAHGCSPQPDGRRAPPWGGALLLAGVLASIVPGARAGELQFHGFAAQGFVLTDHYKFFGDSDDGGSLSYYEAGVNAAYELGPKLIVSGQAFIRDAGATDSGKPRVDFALVDYRLLSSMDGTLGLRVGRVKNPVGFYNETRDVVFTRPSILLPQSVYVESQGTHSLLFASDGAQLYGDLVLGAHTVSLLSTVALHRDLGDGEERLLASVPPEWPLEIDMTRQWNARLMDEFGPWRFAFSHTFLSFDIDTGPERGDVTAKGDVVIDVVSAAWQGAQWSFVAEYAATPNRVKIHLPDGSVADNDHTGDGGYLLAQYRLTPRWTLMTSYDLSYGDQTDRNGGQYARDTGGHRYELFGRDLALGANWRTERHWGIWGEVHLNDGTLAVQPFEGNTAFEHRHWTMLMLMAAYRF